MISKAIFINEAKGWIYYLTIDSKGQKILSRFNSDDFYQRVQQIHEVVNRSTRIENISYSHEIEMCCKNILYNDQEGR